MQDMLRHLRSGMVLDGVTLKPAVVHFNHKVLTGFVGLGGFLYSDNPLQRYRGIICASF